MYVPTAYDSLPSLHYAAKLLDENAKKHLSKDIRQLFLDNNVYDKYGVSCYTNISRSTKQNVLLTVAIPRQLGQLATK